MAKKDPNSLAGKCRTVGIARGTYYRRVRSGMPKKQALTTPSATKTRPIRNIDKEVIDCLPFGAAVPLKTKEYMKLIRIFIVKKNKK